MTEDIAGGELYEQFVRLSEIAFAAGHFEGAYHALIAAMHVAYDRNNTDEIKTVKHMAQEQITWLGENCHDYIMGSTAAMHRGNRSIYDSLQLQANAMILRIRSGKISTPQTQKRPP
jgi:hypothetical protein